MKTAQPTKQSRILKTNIVLGEYFWWKLALAIKNNWRGLRKCCCQVTVLLVSGDVFAKQGERCKEIFMSVLLLCPSLNWECMVAQVLPGFSYQVFIYSGQAFVPKTNQKAELVPEWLFFPSRCLPAPHMPVSLPGHFQQHQLHRGFVRHSSAQTAKGWWWHWVLLGKELTMCQTCTIHLLHMPFRDQHGFFLHKWRILLCRSKHNSVKCRFAFLL